MQNNLRPPVTRNAVNMTNNACPTPPPVPPIPGNHVPPIHVPPATEVDCIEVPKVFDERLIRQCLMYIPGADPTNPTGSDFLRGLIANWPTGATVTDVECGKNFRLTNIDIIQTPAEEDYKNVTANFNIDFDVDVSYSGGPGPITVHFSVPRSINNIKLYCPETKTLIYTQHYTEDGDKVITDYNHDVKKIELIPECLGAETRLIGANLAIDVHLGFNMIIKCELEVQLQVLSRGYCPVPPIIPTPPTPCEEFLTSPPPEFFPKQKVM